VKARNNKTRRLEVLPSHKLERNSNKKQKNEKIK
jgi:hypothetical protein